MALALYAVLALSAFIVSAPLTASLFAGEGMRCSHTLVQLYCAYGVNAAYNPVTYAALATVTAGVMAVAFIFARARSAFPVITLFGTLMLLAIAYDSLLQLPVINASKLANDTFNTLGFVMLASFWFLFFLARGYAFHPLRAVLAIIVSFAMIYFGRVSYVIVSQQTIGATRLYLLFLIYAFGGFSIHLMMLSAMLTTARRRCD